MKDKKMLIVGGGLEGVGAALENAEKGADVTIIEKFADLGAERIPRDRLVKPGEGVVKPDLEKLRNQSNVKVLSYSDIKKLSRENDKIQTRIVKHSLLVDNSKSSEATKAG
ncbi:MAG: NAD(P)-binding domain-containing protein, partial [Deltaproteobacteria bacterium]|nr:NAD(P)-binding domain-containing protein [Deltaproteobacteria bacterium]